MRRIFIIVMAMAMLALLGVACSPSRAATLAPTPVPGQPTAIELSDINVCYTAPSSTQAVPWYAMKKGIFEKYGLRVNLMRVRASSQAVTALITGDLDICEAAGNSVVNAVAAGQDIVMIASLYNTYPSILIARPQIKTVEDLRGKKIGVSATGSASAVATHLALEQLGLNPESDVVLMEAGELPDRVAALRAGQIDASMIDPPYLHILRADGYTELLDFGKSGIPFVHTSIITTRKFVENDRGLAVAFMKAILDAVAQMKNDPEGVKAVMAEYLELDPVANSADLTDAYENVILPFVQQVPYPNLAGLQTVIDFTSAQNPAAATLQPSDLVDMSIVQQLEDSGFIAGLQSR